MRSFYMVSGDPRKYTLVEMLAWQMPVKGGTTNRFVQKPGTEDLHDCMTSRSVSVRTDELPLVAEEPERPRPRCVGWHGTLMEAAMAQQQRTAVGSELNPYDSDR